MTFRALLLALLLLYICSIINGDNVNLIFHEKIPGFRPNCNQIIANGRFLLMGSFGESGYQVEVVDLLDGYQHHKWDFAVGQRFSSVSIAGARSLSIFASYEYHTNRYYATLSVYSIFSFSNSAPLWSRNFSDNGQGTIHVSDVDDTGNGIVSATYYNESACITDWLNVHTGKLLGSWVIRNAERHSSKISDDGKIFALYSVKTVTIIDISSSSSPKLLWEINTGYPVGGIALSPTGKQILIYGYTYTNSNMYFYSYTTTGHNYELKWTSTGPAGYGASVAALTNSKIAVGFFAISNYNENVYMLFSFNDSKPEWSITEKNNGIVYLPKQIVFSNDGKIIAAVNRKYQVNDTGVVVNVFSVGNNNNNRISPAAGSPTATLFRLHPSR
eukprot:TRINITY_DN5707_c0_g1_i2.p1 TRINITY_DN5707_c0_g1~~TRINITY_DN5707_c0_g1_i2.p1  ORF type:complete len:387 (+),score=45.88 TRINITY_DN5707_c0_g1_i2:68-1228(+)